MEKIKDILFEYLTLSIIASMIFLVKCFVAPQLNNYIFIFAIFIIYSRHHHLGEKVTIENVSKNIIATKAISGRKLLNWLDIPTYLIVVLFLSEKTGFYLSSLIFITWFIFTDILRVRRTIYDTYISRWFYTSKININNSKWEMHIADKDPFPSVPHMHATNVPLKLNIYTGEIYDAKTRLYITKASKKDLKKLWTDEKFIISVKNARNIYLQNNPKYKLERMPVFN